MDTAELRKEQERTLSTPRMKYGLIARMVFLNIDLMFGRKNTLSKFKVLEICARVIYQAWENVAYVAITHKHGEPDFARRIFDVVTEARRQMDTEQWHLLILEELTRKQGEKEGFLRYRVFPQINALFLYHMSWLLYVISPRLSYELNAAFEDYAEHEYMEYVSDHPELEQIPFVSSFEKDYGSFASQADLFRRIALDEREHKDESLARVEQARFG